jgi:hypothetical protein
VSEPSVIRYNWTENGWNLVPDEGFVRLSEEDIEAHLAWIEEAKTTYEKLPVTIDAQSASPENKANG